MPSLAQLFAFAAASLVIILIPGPSVLFIIGRALAYGRRSATAQLLVLSTVFSVIAFACDSLYGLVAASARVAFTAPRPRLLLARVGGTAMIGLGVATAAGQKS